MSVRAYRVNKLEYNSYDSFNLWHDEKLVELLEREGYLRRLDEDLCGFLEVPLSFLEDVVKNYRDEIREDTLESLKEDIEFAKAKGESWILYYCF